VGLQPPKSQKNGNCWYKFAPKGKFWGQQKKLNIDAQQQTINNTNFVIHKRVTNLKKNKKTKTKQKQKITLFRLQPARDPLSPSYLSW